MKNHFTKSGEATFSALSLLIHFRELLAFHIIIHLYFNRFARLYNMLEKARTLILPNRPSGHSGYSYFLPKRVKKKHVKSQPSQCTTETARLFGIQRTLVQKERNIMLHTFNTWCVNSFTSHCEQLNPGQEKHSSLTHSSAWYGINITRQKRSICELYFPSSWQLAIKKKSSWQLAPCLDAHEKLEFFHSLSVTSIFRPMHEIINVGKKIINYTV
jgi:hypothetical protein